MFKDEIDLLEIRLRELKDCVDFFVLVESNLSHTNRPKPFIFEENRDRFAPYLSKIRHIKYISSAFQNPWQNENAQRCAIYQGIQDIDPDDLIIVGDADEIVRPESINQIKQSKQDVFGFHMPLFNFKFNFMRIDPGKYDIWSMAARGSWIKQNSPQKLRNLRSSDDFLKIPHGGWHFSYLGDDKWLLEKAQDTCHQEDINQEFLDQLNVGKSIKEKKCWNRYWPYQYEIVDLNDYFPTSCKIFPNHCLNNTGIDVMDFLQDDKICQIENLT